MENSCPTARVKAGGKRMVHSVLMWTSTKLQPQLDLLAIEMSGLVYGLGLQKCSHAVLLFIGHEGDPLLLVCIR